MTDWCVLQTQARTTLRLAQSLGESGIEAWTPTESIIRKARRSHPREERTAALMPRYVFARADRQADLIALTRSLQHRPHFRLMPGLDTPYARVSEAQLSPLRCIAGRRRPKQGAIEFANGDRIRMTEGCYAGLCGTVIDASGSYPEVHLDGWPVNVNPAKWLLHPEHGQAMVA